MFIIPAGEFDLRLSPIHCLADKENGSMFDWIRVQMQTIVPGISSDVEWAMMRKEIAHFHQRLAHMHEAIQATRKPAALEYRSMEGILSLRLEMIDLARGAILVSYTICPDPATGVALTGTTGINQSYLPDMLRGLYELSRYG